MFGYSVGHTLFDRLGKRTNWGGARRAWRLFLAAISSTVSLATETTGGVILVAFWPKHGLRSDLRVPNFKNFPGGVCPQTPLASSHHNGRASLKQLAPALPSQC